MQKLVLQHKHFVLTVFSPPTSKKLSTPLYYHTQNGKVRQLRVYWNRQANSRTKMKISFMLEDHASGIRTKNDGLTQCFLSTIMQCIDFLSVMLHHLHGCGQKQGISAIHNLLPILETQIFILLCKQNLVYSVLICTYFISLGLWQKNAKYGSVEPWAWPKLGPHSEI